MKKQRPVNLDIPSMDLPATAKASILHRVTGVAMFFAMVFLLWAWATSLSSEQGFKFVADVMTSPIAKLIAIGIVSVLVYHLMAGIRHMIGEAGYGEELESGNASAKLIIGLWIVLTISAGVWLW